MGSGGDGGGREPGRNVRKPDWNVKRKKVVSSGKPTASKPKLRDTIVRNPISSRRGDFQENNPFKTERGPSPGDVKATFGAVEGIDGTSRVSKRSGETRDYSADVVAGNVAGRPGLNVANMGDLATRARVGQMPDKRVDLPKPFSSLMPGGMYINILNTIGRGTAGNVMKKIASDTPTTVEGKVTYGTNLVKDDSDRIMGIIDKGGRYSGRHDYNPNKLPKPESGASPVAAAPTTSDASPEVIKTETGTTQSRKFALTGGLSDEAARILLKKNRRR